MTAKKLHVDIETFSSIDIKQAGAYKYIESIDFEVLMVAFAFDDRPIEIIDLAQGEKLPQKFIDALFDTSIEKHAHNATFERRSFQAIGYDIPAENWHCTAVKAAYCGLPLSLEEVSKAMKLEEKGKSSTGKALIRYFACPIKPTKVNGQRERNYPHHNIDKWNEFKQYCIQDVEAEREIDNRLLKYQIPDFERRFYALDQKINDRGVLIDLIMAENVIVTDGLYTKDLTAKVKEITGIDNPNSPAQLKKWLESEMQIEIKSLAKESVTELISIAGAGAASDVLQMRQKLAKTSIKKYKAMLACACEDMRGRGLFQFYGANRTGRWAGRLIQLQNLPRNYVKDLFECRGVIKSGDYDLASMLYDDISNLLSQLIRTAFIAKPEHTFAVADFSAIEARVIAWMAKEQWRLDVFETHGKIYEASASMMFNVPIETVTKGSSYRDKGKIAELALGYQGALGALKKMGGEEMGLSDAEMKVIVNKWRKANPMIVALWQNIESCAIEAIRHRRPVVSKYENIIFNCDGEVFTIQLPSGRKLYYQNPTLTTNQWDKPSIKYKGMDQTTKQWTWIDTYGGKLTENIVQAIARDLLAFSMMEIDSQEFDIVIHVHDEVVAEIPKTNQEIELERLCNIMSQTPTWATGLPLAADGYTTEFYKKD